MPNSTMSRFSTVGPTSGQQGTNVAASIAKDFAKQEVSHMIERGLLDKNDKDRIREEFRRTYSHEYYRIYNIISTQVEQRVIYLQNPADQKYQFPHTPVNFSKTNCLIQVHRGCITVGRINFPIDEDTSIETKEAFLSAWPGPLDRNEDRRRVTQYIDTLWQHDSQRRIKYCSGFNDEQRKIILRLLTELLHRNGTIDASGITRLLLRPEQTEIQKDEADRKPLDTLQKYLLLGKRVEAIKFARTKKLWEHSQCLAFLDKYQPPNTRNYVKDGIRLRDDSIVQLNDEYINSVKQNILSTVYRSLLNRILQSDPESVNIIKHPKVGNNPYEFAMLSANDCEMDFDQSNEIFKLIMAVKNALTNPALSSYHIINLGYTTLEFNEPSDDISYTSHQSFKKGEETYASRMLTISNIDMLVLNEIWEYSLNLARGTCNPTNYEYITNLIPYKLFFATRLLDYGLHTLFENYLYSIKSALAKARCQQFLERDNFYDWNTIEMSVESLSRIWDIYKMSPESNHYQTTSYESPIATNESMVAGFSQRQSFNPIQSLPAPVMHIENQADFPDSSQLEYSSLPYQRDAPFSQQHNYPPPRQNTIPSGYYSQPPIQEEVNDFNPESEPTLLQGNDKNQFEPQTSYKDYYTDESRRQSTDIPVFSPPHSFGPPMTGPADRNQKTMKSSSPVSKGKESVHPNVGDSFVNSPLSPINDYDDLTRQDSEVNRRNSTVQNSAFVRNEPDAPSSSSNATNDVNGKSQSAMDQQQSNFFTNLVGSARAFLPKSNSKQMILPDDSSKSIVYDDKKGAWIDTTQPEGIETGETLEAPPMMMDSSSKPPSYSFVTKSSKSRYPKAQF